MLSNLVSFCPILALPTMKLHDSRYIYNNHHSNIQSLTAQSDVTHLFFRRQYRVLATCAGRRRRTSAVQRGRRAGTHTGTRASRYAACSTTGRATRPRGPRRVVIVRINHRTWTTTLNQPRSAQIMCTIPLKKSTNAKTFEIKQKKEKLYKLLVLPMVHFTKCSTAKGREKSSKIESGVSVQ